MKFSKEDLIGKHLLLGISYLNEHGVPDKTVQEHGTVIACDGGVVEFQPVGATKTIRIPYNPSFYEPAEPDAVYVLRTTGEEIRDVDVVVAFEVRPPAGNMTQ